MAVSFRPRRGTAHEWEVRNPRLGSGEMGFEIDTGRFKLGDGVHDWMDLPYFTNEAVIRSYIETGIAELAAGVTGLTVDDLNNHINSETPHPVYDDGPRLDLLYETQRCDPCLFRLESVI